MEELIWFSVPGAVLAGAIVTVWPATADTEPKAVVWVVIAPIIGFIIHQFFRLLFESSGGFAHRSRTVLHLISTVLPRRVNLPALSLEKAFLVWEVTFYSEDFPSSFRDHDRGAWHYILSFWGIGMAAAIALVVCLSGSYFGTGQSTNTQLMALLDFCVAVIMYFKGRATFRSLMQQETAIFHVHEGLFLKTVQQLDGMG